MSSHQVKTNTSGSSQLFLKVQQFFAHWKVAGLHKEDNSTKVASKESEHVLK